MGRYELRRLIIISRPIRQNNDDVKVRKTTVDEEANIAPEEPSLEAPIQTKSSADGLPSRAGSRQ